MSDDKNRLSKGLVIGFVAGAITALLTAPKSGKELRSDLRKKVKDLRDIVVDHCRSVGQKFRSL